MPPWGAAHRPLEARVAEGRGTDLAPAGALTLIMAEGYGIVHWRYLNLINLQCELPIHPTNHNMV